MMVSIDEKLCWIIDSSRFCRNMQLFLVGTIIETRFFSFSVNELLTPVLEPPAANTALILHHVNELDRVYACERITLCVVFHLIYDGKLPMDNGKGTGQFNLEEGNNLEILKPIIRIMDSTLKIAPMMPDGNPWEVTETASSEFLDKAGILNI